jgi:hypothetical protein
MVARLSPSSGHHTLMRLPLPDGTMRTTIAPGSNTSSASFAKASTLARSGSAVALPALSCSFAAL